MSVLRIGIAGVAEFKARTLAIASGRHRPHPGEPKVWFSSIDSLAKVLSDRNRDLLRLIAETQPESLDELAKASGRAPSNLSRTLHTMEQYGLVSFEKGEGRRRVPRVAYASIEVDLPLAKAG